MKSVLNEISRLRQATPISVDLHNRNRYRLVVQENNGTKTAYCFGTPIYNQKTRKLIDMNFRVVGNDFYAEGSNTDISISQDIIIKNEDGSVAIELPQKPLLISQNETRSGNWILSPTTNGIAVKCDIKEAKTISFIIKPTQPFLNIRSNDRCLALMKGEFRPLAVMSCIGALDRCGNVIAPAHLEYKKLTDKKFRIFISSASPIASAVSFELNMYENKLFQDTTVESKNPLINNAFGTVGFIGNSAACGEQWLYSRLDYSRIPEIMERRIHKAVLHIPKLNSIETELRAFKVSARFCSFGSNWNNKIACGPPVSDSLAVSGYQSLDITSLIADSHTKIASYSEGLILKPKINVSGFSVIATGDCCFAPQILEINYR